MTIERPAARQVIGGWLYGRPGASRRVRDAYDHDADRLLEHLASAGFHVTRVAPAVTSSAPDLCPKGKPFAGRDWQTSRYSCRFCHTWVHNPRSDCGCSTERPAVTYHAPLCHACTEAVDALYDDTPLGRVHRALVQEAALRHMPSSD